MTTTMSFFEELKRRNVFKVAIAYVAMSWAVLQVADVIINNIGAPDWLFRALLLVLAVGLPFAIFLAWLYELTPDGIKRESDIADSAAAPRRTENTLNYVIISALVIAVIFLGVFRGGEDAVSDTSMSAILSRPTVVVFPFANTSGDEDQNYLSLGITNELITGLQRYKDFPVVSRDASLEYEKTGLSAGEFARKFQALYQVEGSVTMVGEGIRVLATLSRVDGEQVWADRFERNSGKTELFDLADELVSQVASAVLDSEIERVHRSNRPPADAWEHYIRGLELLVNFSPAEFETARYHFDQAIEIAPDMAEAWWALGELEISNYITKSNLEKTGLDELHTIIEYFRKSHELSPFYAAACGCLGYMLAVVGEPDEARVVFGQAIEANPLSADLFSAYSTFLLMSGSYEEAMEASDVVLKLGPNGYDRAAVWSNRAIVALAAGDSAGALDAMNRALFIDRNIFNTPIAIALTYVAGDHDAAARLMDELDQISPGISPENPVLYGVLKPIDDILALRSERGEISGPANVVEIFAALRGLE
jgi:TolB-like protein/Flp pilus assembly protein TadD